MKTQTAFQFEKLYYIILNQSWNFSLLLRSKIHFVSVIFDIFIIKKLNYIYIKI